jgi:hypothetical protein
MIINHKCLWNIGNIDGKMKKGWKTTKYAKNDAKMRRISPGLFDGNYVIFGA